MEITKYDIFEFLRENLTVETDTRHPYDADYKEVVVMLKLRNPETGENEVISRDTFNAPIE